MGCWAMGGRVLGWLPSAILGTIVDLVFAQVESRKERQVQQLQLPCWEPGHELPTTTLLPFLAAVGHCCSQGKSKKPSTLLSHCRCCCTHLTESCLPGSRSKRHGLPMSLSTLDPVLGDMAGICPLSAWAQSAG